MEGGDTPDSVLADRRQRRRRRRQDEVSLDSVSTISKLVEETEGRRKKKLKKIKETPTDNPEDGEEKKAKKKKKKGQSGSVSSSEEGYVSEKKHKKRKEKKKLTGSQTHLLKEDFYSDRELATTLQGLEEDMYSVTGDGDTSTILSPYPPSLLPGPLPPSQPVAKIYTEKNGGFSRTKASDPPLSASGPGKDDSVSSGHQMSPLELGLVTQRVWRAAATFCHGLLAGLAAWQVRGESIIQIQLVSRHTFVRCSLSTPSTGWRLRTWPS